MSEDDPGERTAGREAGDDPGDGDGSADASVDDSGEGDASSGGDPRDGGASTGGSRNSFLDPIRRFWNAEEGAVVLVRDLLSSALMVLLVAGILFGASGVWPPMVAVKSGSMNPHMQKGDLVFVTEESRFSGEGAVAETGIVTNRAGSDTDHRKFGDAGDVIVYRPDNRSDRDPIIHRAMFYVEDGENWYDRANESYVDANSCRELRNCPAPNAGFITKGDNPESNQYYDQAGAMSRPVDPDWVKAKAMVRIPALGWIRLKWAELQYGGAAAGALALVGGRNLYQRRVAS